MRKLWHLLCCELFGHVYAHPVRAAYRCRVNYCSRCHSPVYIRALREE